MERDAEPEPSPRGVAHQGFSKAVTTYFKEIKPDWVTALSLWQSCSSPEGFPAPKKHQQTQRIIKSVCMNSTADRKKNVLAVQGLRRSCSRKEQEWSKEQKSAEILSTEH